MAGCALPTYPNDRKLRIYLPHDYHQSKKRYPVIYMMDGQNLFDTLTANAGEWKMDEMMEQLSKNNSALTAIIVGVDHAGKNRSAEYHPFSYSKDVPERIGAS